MLRPDHIWSPKRLAEICQGIWVRQPKEPFAGAVRTDSRGCRKGDLFAALAGEHVDGHDFVEDVLRSLPLVGGPASISFSDASKVMHGAMDPTLAL